MSKHCARKPGRQCCLLYLPLLFLWLMAGPADAQTKPSPPAGMTQQQYDELVKSVGLSVIQTLEEKGLIAKTQVAPTAAAPSAAEAEPPLAEQVVAIVARIPKVLAGYPGAAADLAQLGTRLDQTSSGGRGMWSYLALLLAVGAAALLVEAGIGRLTGARRDSLARQFGASGGLWRVGVVAILDGLAWLALWAVAQFGQGVLFAKSGGQTQFAAIVLASLVAWRAYALFLRLFLRPDRPEIRIAPIAEENARRLYRLFGLAILVFVVARGWVRILTTPAVLDAAILTNSFLVVVILVLLVIRTRRDIAAWLLGLIAEGPGRKGFRAALAEHWHWIALPILIVLGCARAYDALSDQFAVPVGAILTLNVIIGLLLAETLWAFIVRSNRTSAMAESGAQGGGRLVSFLVRAARATLWVVAAAVVVRAWVVDVLSLLDEQGWQRFSHAWTEAILTALGAYLAWEAVRFATAPRSVRPLGAMPGAENEAAPAPASASRLETLAPILRVALGILIVVTAALMILSSLGISITPFIAGASVFGLAISFGSQTLVHDIVSGLFYLADDAFRVGEYIDCGKAKGTVEGFTLRSIKLRHQNGPVHTIPFGQLGQITNFSRDYSTLKFNLRFDRSTDLDKLRKVTKKVGQAMLADPELKDDFLEPLKLQGIADIADSAMVMRFKMTVKPTRPSYIQREAVKRLITAFKEAGIEFASATVAVQAIGAPPTDIASAAAAAAAAKTS
jgi:small-conductance mechanosensitive channel